MGINKIFCPTVYIFRPIWTQFGTQEEVIVSFVKIGVVKATIDLRVYMNLYLYFPHFTSALKFGTGYLHILLFNFGEFHQKRSREGLTFLQGK